MVKLLPTARRQLAEAQTQWHNHAVCKAVLRSLTVLMLGFSFFFLEREIVDLKRTMKFLQDSQYLLSSKLKVEDPVVHLLDFNATGTFAATSVSSTTNKSVCEEEIPSRLLKRPKPSAFPQLLKVDNGEYSNANTSAVCMIAEAPYFVHFPHTMQQVYRCWSYWESQPGKPVLALPEKLSLPESTYAPTSTGSYNQGMFRALKDIGVTTVLASQLSREEEALAIPANNVFLNTSLSGVPWSRSGFFLMKQPQHTFQWTHKILESKHIPRINCQLQSPIRVRVGILNRNNTRSILNARHLINQLTLLPIHINITADETMFEDKSFDQQIAWFTAHDIVVSGHGAQLTSFPFMPQCGGVLELFPRGYYFPWYFGTLGDFTHVQHYSLYERQATEKEINEETDQWNTYVGRIRARSRNFCPATQQTLASLLNMIQDWFLCCQRLQ